jgi:hypothetical protein
MAAAAPSNADLAQARNEALSGISGALRSVWLHVGPARYGASPARDYFVAIAKTYSFPSDLSLSAL